MTNGVCVVIGVGPGNGRAFTNAFSEAGYAVAMLARSQDYLSELESAIPSCKGYPCDMSDVDQISQTLSQVSEDLGNVDVLIYNAGSGQWGALMDTDIGAFEQAWAINTRGLFCAAQGVVPGMLDNNGGAIVVVGATASLRGGAKFAAFASAKSAQRSLAQSMARDLGPKGIHVSYLIIDGGIDTPRARERNPDRPKETLIQPDSIARTALELTRQDRSAWTFEVDLRPFCETW